MTDRQPTLDDALYVLGLHNKTGCMHFGREAAEDYAARITMKDGHLDYGRFRLGFQYILDGLQKAEDKRKAET
jgi:hypothetical protein